MERAREVVNQVNRVILGKEKEVQEVMLAFLAGGHILSEDFIAAQRYRYMRDYLGKRSLYLNWLKYFG